jgi:beta-glucosidase
MMPDIEVLISQLTLEEKISLLAGADMWHTNPIERLGIPVLKVTDGPNGARGTEETMGSTSVCFPAGIALAATWNTELVECVGQALGDETRAKGAHLLLGPTVNMHRTPLSGRNFEFYSEDPYLAGRMATAYIRGLQSRGVGACIKHFVCNESEFERQTISSVVTERPLREIYLKPFEMALREANPWSLMPAYNKLNGVYASENARLLKDILKDEWQFDGLVISDWFGTYGPGIVGNGLDLEMPGPARWMGEAALEAVRSGQVSESEIDDSVRRLLRTLQRAGVFDQPELQPEQAIDLPEHRQLVRAAAAEAIVLLKNDNNILPLATDRIRSIAVIGANAQQPAIIGGGSAAVTPHYAIKPIEAIAQRAGKSIKVEFELGSPLHKMMPLLDKSKLTADDGRSGFTVESFNNTELAGAPVDGLFIDRMSIDFTSRVLPKTNRRCFSVRLSANFTPDATGRYTFGLEGSGHHRLLVNGVELIDCWTDRPTFTPAWTRAEKTAAIDLTAGEVYRLTVEYAVETTAPWRRLRVGCLPPLAPTLLADAVALAARSDVALVFAGTTNEWESEGSDRPGLELPCAQTELIEQVSAVNPNTIVVLNTGAPVAMPWLDKVAAVLEGWFAGQESGNAITEVLFGDVNPSGKLSQTFPRRLQDTPAYMNYPGENGAVYYGEGLFIGYRYYDKKDITPLFPFGYGLSYTTFAYSNLAFNASHYSAADEIRVSLDVQNTGNCAGQEVVQLYVRDVQSSLMRPDKELKAFAKVSLQPSETKTVTFTLDREALSFYDPRQKQWLAEPGEFEVLIGSSSRDIRLSSRFELAHGSDVALLHAGRLHVGLPLKIILDDRAGRVILEQHLGELLRHPQTVMMTGFSLEQIAASMPQYVSPQTLQRVNAALIAA